MPEGGPSIPSSTTTDSTTDATTNPAAHPVPGPAAAPDTGRAAPGTAPGPAATGRGPADPALRARAGRTSLLVTLILGGLTATPPLAMDMYLPALPEVTQALHAPAATVQLTLTACLAGMALGQLVVGPMSDRWGRRRPLLVGLAVYVVATVLCALAPTVDLLVAFRLAQGLAGAAGIVIARAVARDLYDGVAMARFFSTLMLISGLAPIVAPVIGGQILRVTDWRGVFVVLTVVGVLLTAVVWAKLPETLAPADRHGGGVGEALGSMRRLLADRAFTGYMLAGGFAFAALFAYVAASPFVVQEIYGASPQTFSLLFGLNSIGLLIVGQINGKVLVGRVSLDLALGLGLAVVTLASVVLLLMASGVFGEVGLVPVAAALFVLMSAMGITMPNTQTLALLRTKHAAGSASALLGTTSFLIGAIASPLVGIAGEDTAVPMAVVQLASAVVALACFLGMCRPWNRPTSTKGGGF
ncbi:MULTISPECIES: multidrug effflux MFS transporter [Streptomyces]|jgi:DHA1 family bicyclomycin/chloramphenicol resistance-like MFS transporter|uniref:Bcr/CflA family drug resistance efflux transporter n=2 Tax=Streptomyces TaxID=1883 RepID=A0A514JVQ0_9ACTN|nr:multidrug effflux MFS transporter [Streptomyces calvus]MBA8978731.1 DHA1 family bicyclomycin/chloramphenicol resistance-like MFS transporter [Streptomyces calvus]QDI71421.1 Bcr/CflA family drug resistance efflux transporter [Streptomyces calvus]